MARLADYSNDEGLSWPAVETIQRQIGAKSKNTVSAAIDELEKGGWLVKEERKAGGRNLSNLYHLNVEKIESAAAAARAAYKPKKRGSRVKPPIIDPSTNNPSNIDPSKFDPSTVEKAREFNPPIIDPDPSVNSKQDPSVDSKPICPVAPQPDPEVLLTDNAILVLTHLNLVSGSRYQKSKSSLENIRARLREGYSVCDLKLVIDLKHEHWSGNDKMYRYMRPETLFGPKKFEGYLNDAVRWEGEGKRQLGRVGDQNFKASYDNVDYSTVPEGFRS
jgi:uncharacterized phage protein (TIGR02220 family)